ncbi:MAG: energy transducer TonB [Bacteroidales bacterium]|nr:MAG: energy transducer TonB [Bacteroidales bacterium]
MKPKKSKQANLESRRGIYLQAGFVIVLSFILIAFEWTSSEINIHGWNQPDTENVPEPNILLTYRKQEVVRPPAPKLPVDFFTIKHDSTEIPNEFEANSTEITMETIIWDFPEVLEKEAAETEPFVAVEFMPLFQGGDLITFCKYVQSNITYPEEARNLGIEGTVIVQFIVNSKGNVVNVTVVRSINTYLDTEAVRVISSSPVWKPGIQAGKPVPVIFTIPIKFELQ